MKLNKMMNEFMDTYGVERTEITAEGCMGALTLIEDEVTEFSEEFCEYDFYEGVNLFEDDCINKANVAKEMADIIYVTAQRMVRMGIDADAVMSEVHRSNMSKRVPSATLDIELEEARRRYPEVIPVHVEGEFFVLRDPTTGKVVKPMCYSAAVITKEMVNELPSR